MAEEPEPEGQPEVPRLEEVQALRETLAAISVRNSGELPSTPNCYSEALPGACSVHSLPADFSGRAESGQQRNQSSAGSDKRGRTEDERGNVDG